MNKQAMAKELLKMAKELVAVSPQDFRQHVTFSQDGLSVEDKIEFFSHFDIEGDEPEYSIDKKMAQRIIRALIPVVEAIMRKHGVTGKMRIITDVREGYVSLMIDKPRQNGKPLDYLADILEEFEKLAPWDKQ